MKARFYLAIAGIVSIRKGTLFFALPLLALSLSVSPIFAADVYWDTNGSSPGATNGTTAPGIWDKFLQCLDNELGRNEPDDNLSNGGWRRRSATKCGRFLFSGNERNGHVHGYGVERNNAQYHL
jgi:hypothetical protein